MDPEVKDDENQTTSEQDESQFLAGLSNEPTETPAQEEPVEDAAPAEPAPKYAQITEEQLARFMTAADELQKLQATVDKSNGTAFGKIGGIERVIAEIRTSMTAGAPALDMADDELDSLEQDFPSLAAFARKLKAARPVTVDQDALLAKLREQIPVADIEARATEMARRQFREEQLADQHEDWKTVTSLPEFAAFAQSKGEDYFNRLAQASTTWNHRVIGQALTEFKAAKKAADGKDTTRRNRIEASVTPKGTPAPVAGVKTDEDYFAEGLKASR